MQVGLFDGHLISKSYQLLFTHEFVAMCCFLVYKTQIVYIKLFQLQLLSYKCECRDVEKDPVLKQIIDFSLAVWSSCTVTL